MEQSTLGAYMAPPAKRDDVLFYCEQHGVLNKPSNVKNKIDEVTKRV